MMTLLAGVAFGAALVAVAIVTFLTTLFALGLVAYGIVYALGCMIFEIWWWFWGKWN